MIVMIITADSADPSSPFPASGHSRLHVHAGLVAAGAVRVAAVVPLDRRHVSEAVPVATRAVYPARTPHTRPARARLQRSVSAGPDTGQWLAHLRPFCDFRVSTLLQNLPDFTRVSPRRKWRTALSYR